MNITKKMTLVLIILTTTVTRSAPQKIFTMDKKLQEMLNSFMSTDMGIQTSTIPPIPDNTRQPEARTSTQEDETTEGSRVDVTTASKNETESATTASKNGTESFTTVRPSTTPGHHTPTPSLGGDTTEEGSVSTASSVPPEAPDGEIKGEILLASLKGLIFMNKNMHFIFKSVFPVLTQPYEESLSIRTM